MSKAKETGSDAPLFGSSKSTLKTAWLAQQVSVNKDDLSLCASDVDQSNLTDMDWIIDSGCTTHFTHNKDLFTTFTKDKGSAIRGIGGQFSILGHGTVQLGSMKLNNVAYAPDMPFNLFSTKQAIEHGKVGILYDINGDVKLIFPNGSTRKIATLSNNLYVITNASKSTYAEKAFAGHTVSIKSSTKPVFDPLLPTEISSTPIESIIHARIGHTGMHIYNSIAPIIDASTMNTSTTTLRYNTTVENLPPTSSDSEYVHVHATKKRQSTIQQLSNPVYVPTELSTLDDHEFNTLPVADSSPSIINHIPVDSAYTDRVKHFLSKQNWSPSGHSLADRPVAAIDQLFNSDNAIVLRNPDNELTHTILQPEVPHHSVSEIPSPELPHQQIALTAIAAGHSQISTSLSTPRNITDALHGEKSTVWRNACHRELQVFKDHNT